MAFWVRTVLTGSGIALAVSLGGCGTTGSSAVATVAMRSSSDTVEAWRAGWRPEAETFWDRVEAWESTTNDGRSDPATTVGAAASIVAAGSEWKAALADPQLPGDVTAKATELAGALGTTVTTWSDIGTCGSDAACVANRVGKVQTDLYSVRSAQFALRP